MAVKEKQNGRPERHGEDRQAGNIGSNKESGDVKKLCGDSKSSTCGDEVSRNRVRV